VRYTVFAILTHVVAMESIIQGFITGKQTVEDEWNTLTETQLDRWKGKLLSAVQTYNPRSLGILRLKEILHYTSREDVLRGTVLTKPDQAYVDRLFAEVWRGTAMCINSVLADPDAMYPGRDTTTGKCRRCKSSNVLTYAKQTRSSDEPTDFFSQCVSCNQTWKCFPKASRG